jgi:hypothetical protein
LKEDNMKKLLGFLLGLSLAANAWLLFARASRLPATEKSAATATRGATPLAKPAAGLSVAILDSADLAALRDALRAVGVDEPTVRAVLEGILRRRERERLAAVRIARIRAAWWRSGRTADFGDAKLAKEMITDPLQRLLGRDPADLADAESRYAFLPLEKRRLLAQIDNDYRELQSRVPQSVMNTQLQAEAKEQTLLADERRKDVLAALTPEERTEYDLRFSGSAGPVSRRAGTMVATEPEFRALKPVLDDFELKSRAIPRDDNFTAAYSNLNQGTVQQLVAALGYDRAVDYIWSGSDAEFSALRRATEAAQLPPTTPAQVMELATGVGQQAARVHDDTSLTLDQKRAALLTLQQTARVQLATLLPPAAMQTLPADQFRWLDALGDGRYLMPMPNLDSSGGYAIFSLSNPPPPRRPDRTIIPPRPGK